MATASTSRRGSKPWPISAGCSSPIEFMITSATGCLLSSRISASSRSKTLPAGACLPGARLQPRRQELIAAGSPGAAAAGQAVDRGVAFRQYERRSRAGVFRRRHGRGGHHSTLLHPLAVRERRGHLTASLTTAGLDL